MRLSFYFFVLKMFICVHLHDRSMQTTYSFAGLTEGASHRGKSSSILSEQNLSVRCIMFVKREEKLGSINDLDIQVFSHLIIPMQDQYLIALIYNFDTVG